jgi:hypothetical protein
VGAGALPACALKTGTQNDRELQTQLAVGRQFVPPAAGRAGHFGIVPAFSGSF